MVSEKVAAGIDAIGALMMERHPTKSSNAIVSTWRRVHAPDYGEGGPLSSPLYCITATMPPNTAMPATTHNASWSAHIVLWLPGAELHPAVAKDAATTRTARGSGWIRTPRPPRTHRSDIIEVNCGV